MTGFFGSGRTYQRFAPSLTINVCADAIDIAVSSIATAAAVNMMVRWIDKCDTIAEPTRRAECESVEAKRTRDGHFE